MLKDAFGSTGWMSIRGEYKDKDFDVVYLEARADDDDELSVPYETISSYSAATPPLSERWLSEYSETIDDLDENLFLVITQRAVAFTVERREELDPRVGFKAIGWGDRVYRYVVVIDMSGLRDEDYQRRLISQGKQLLIEFRERIDPYAPA